MSNPLSVHTFSVTFMLSYPALRTKVVLFLPTPAAHSLSVLVSKCHRVSRDGGDFSHLSSLSLPPSSYPPFCCSSAVPSTFSLCLSPPSLFEVSFDRVGPARLLPLPSLGPIRKILMKMESPCPVPGLSSGTVEYPTTRGMVNLFFGLC